MITSEALYDLEGLDKKTVVTNSGLSYSRFRQTLLPDYRRVRREIAFGWCALLFIDALLLWYRPDSGAKSVAAAVLGGLAIGYAIAYLHLFFHEAVHFNLAPERKQSDRLANFWLGPLLLSCVEFYRHIHFAHHRLLGTRDDTENSYFQPLSPRFLLYSISGQRVAQVFLSRARTQSVLIPPEARVKHLRFFLMGAAGHAGVVLLALVANAWVFAAAWSLGVICFTPFFGAVRQLLEHRQLGTGRENFATQDPGKFTRTFRPGLFGSTFGAAGFNRHLIHHWDPALSYTCLEPAERFLLTTPLREGYLLARKSYFQVFKELYADSQSSNRDTALLELRRHST